MLENKHSVARLGRNRLLRDSDANGFVGMFLEFSTQKQMLGYKLLQFSAFKLNPLGWNRTRTVMVLKIKAINFLLVMVVTKITGWFVWYFAHRLIFARSIGDPDKIR